jgi:hypothetical protein
MDMDNVVSINLPGGSCELGKPHTATCGNCRDQSQWIHAAAQRIKEAADTAAELLELARGSRGPERRLTLVTAAGILMQLISKTAELEIVDYTCEGQVS